PPFPLFSRWDTKINLSWPRSVAVGLKYDICPHRRFGADVIWFDWAHAFDQIGLQFSNPTNPIVPFIAPVPVKDAFPLNWRDTVSMRLGYEFDTNDRDTWRLGYVYHASPVPDSTLNPYLDGILQHAFSLGFSRKLDWVVFNAAYQYTFGPT